MGVLASAIAFVIVIGAVRVPDLEEPVASLSRSLGQWTYLIVAVFAFFETAAFVGLAVPGETAVLAGGMVAHRGDVELVPLIVAVWLAAAAGDTTSFLIGRRLGRRFLASHGARLRLDAPRLARIDRFYVRHGAAAVIAGRFVGVVRAVMPFLAGTSQMATRRFVAYSITGALAWAALLTGVGYGFSGSVGAADDAVTRVALGAVLIVALVLLVSRRISSANGADRGRTAADGDHLRGDDGVAGDERARPPLRRTYSRASRSGIAPVVVNGRASAAGRTRLLDEVTARLGDEGLRVDMAVTHSEAELLGALAAAGDRRVVLVGGDGSLHAAANVPLAVLPEIALIPAGRANNIARALGIPTDIAAATRLAARAAAQPIDALHVQTPQRSVYALEAVSAGFHADVRSRYVADNSGDIRQGVGLLAGAVARYAPYRLEVMLDDHQIVVPAGAQLFLSNLPFFGFGFEVNPGADPRDGRFEAVLIQAATRRALVAQLVATRGGRHVGRPGVQRIAAQRALVTDALPLVADTTALGTTTATVSIVPAHLHIVISGTERCT